MKLSCCYASEMTKEPGQVQSFAIGRSMSVTLVLSRILVATTKSPLQAASPHSRCVA